MVCYKRIATNSILGKALKLSILKTNNFNPWTEHYARNVALKKAKGDKLICMDIDHIITKKLIDFVLNSDCDVVKFQRRFGVLDEGATLRTDRKTMIKYGALKSRIKKHGCRIPPPGNVFAITKDLFLSVRRQPGKFWHILKKMARRDEISFCKTEERPLVYMFPIGRYCGDIDADPLKLFHGLSRQTEAYKDAERYAGAR